MEINKLKQIKINVKKLYLYLKVSDRFCGSLLDQDDNMVVDFDGLYVPDFMPGQHYGDYVILDIDIDTGQILNWKTPSAESLTEFIEEIESWDKHKQTNIE